MSEFDRRRLADRPFGRSDRVGVIVRGPSCRIRDRAGDAIASDLLERRQLLGRCVDHASIGRVAGVPAGILEPLDTDAGERWRTKPFLRAPAVDDRPGDPDLPFAGLASSFAKEGASHDLEVVIVRRVHWQAYITVGDEAQTVTCRAEPSPACPGSGSGSRRPSARARRT